MLLRDIKKPKVATRDRRIERTLTSKEKRQSFTREVSDYFTTWRLEPDDQAYLEALLGVRGRAAQLPWSDMRGLGEASRTAKSLMLATFEQATKGRRFFWISLTDDTGTTSDRVPVFLLDAVRKKAGQALRSAGLNALMALHMHPVINHPRRKLGRSLMIHYHAIAWTDDPAFDPVAFVAKLTAARAWKNSLGAPVVTIEQIEKRSAVRTKSRYMFRAAHDAKNRRPHEYCRDLLILTDTMEGYRPELATRVFEGMSQIGLCEIFTGIGEGKRVASQLRKALNDWHRGRTQPVVVPGEFDTWSMWARLRGAPHGSPLFQPFRIVGGGITSKRNLAAEWAKLEALDRGFPASSQVRRRPKK